MCGKLDGKSVRNLISQNAVCGTHARDRAIYCSKSLSLRENRIIRQSVCHRNILLGVTACVSHQCFGSLCTVLPPSDEKSLDKICQHARLNCVLHVTPKGRKVMGPFKPHFCTF